MAKTGLIRSGGGCPASRSSSATIRPGRPRRREIDVMVKRITAAGDHFAIAGGARTPDLEAWQEFKILLAGAF